MIAALGVFREKRLNNKRGARQGKLVKELSDGVMWGKQEPISP